MTRLIDLIVENKFMQCLRDLALLTSRIALLTPKKYQNETDDS